MAERSQTHNHVAMSSMLALFLESLVLEMIIFSITSD